uniref:Uncharacterized protein n=1 Tax=Glossina pallidipes TaxID=7398 RepID=A0A1A9Z0P3_GLOPL
MTKTTTKDKKPLGMPLRLQRKKSYKSVTLRLRSALRQTLKIFMINKRSTYVPAFSECYEPKSADYLEGLDFCDNSIQYSAVPGTDNHYRSLTGDSLRYNSYSIANSSTLHLSNPLMCHESYKELIMIAPTSWQVLVKGTEDTSQPMTLFFNYVTQFIDMSCKTKSFSLMIDFYGKLLCQIKR